MLSLAPPSGKIEHSKESSNSSLQIPSKGLSNSVLYSSLAVSVLKLLMLEIACLQGHIMMGKK